MSGGQEVYANASPLSAEVGELSAALADARTELELRTQYVQEFNTQLTDVTAVVRTFENIKANMEAKLSSACDELNEQKTASEAEIRREQESRELAEHRLQDLEARHVRVSNRMRMECDHLQSRLLRLEKNERAYREQLRRERQKREEAERKLYTDRQGSIKRNIRSILSVGGFASPSSSSGNNNIPSSPKEAEYRKCLDDAEATIKRMENDLLIELERRQQLERIVSARETDETGGPGEHPVSVQQEHMTPEPMLLFGSSVSTGGSRDRKSRLNNGQTGPAAAALEETKTNGQLSGMKTPGSSSMTSITISPDGKHVDGDDIFVPRRTMQTIREQLVSLSAERDALLHMDGDVSGLVQRTLSNVATTPSMLKDVRARHGGSDDDQSPFAVGRLTEMMRSKELIHLKLVEALRQEKARCAAMEALLVEGNEPPKSETVTAPTKHTAAELSKLESMLQHETDARRQAVTQRDEAVENTAEMRRNLDDVVQELMDAKEEIDRLKGTSAAESPFTIPSTFQFDGGGEAEKKLSPSSERRGSFAFF